MGMRRGTNKGKTQKGNGEEGEGEGDDGEDDLRKMKCLHFLGVYFCTCSVFFNVHFLRK